MIWFTADEHYGHAAIIKRCERPYKTVEEMDADLIEGFNAVVDKDDVVVHAGDFAWKLPQEYIRQLNGAQIFLRGSHDNWLPKSAKYIWQKRIEGQLVIVCHYAMRRWEQSHYGSWQLFGHSHGRLTLEAKQWDIGVDNNCYRPVSFEEVRLIMAGKPDNPNLIR